MTSSRHFEDTELPVPARKLAGRDERLLALAQQAVLDGAQEVVLDDDALDALAAVGRDEARPIPHVDVWVEVRAPTTMALTKGAFTLAVCGIGRTGAAVGRFLDLLPDTDRQRMVGLYGRLPTGVEGALATQLSFPPQHPRVENILRAPLVLPDVICLAEHRDDVPNRIPVQDLAVTADHDRLYMASLSRRRVVEPVLPHAGTQHTMSPVCPRRGGSYAYTTPHRIFGYASTSRITGRPQAASGRGQPTCSGAASWMSWPLTGTTRRPDGTGPGRPWPPPKRCSSPIPRRSYPAQGCGQLAGDPPTGAYRGESGRLGLRHDGRFACWNAVAYQPFRIRSSCARS